MAKFGAKTWRSARLMIVAVLLMCFSAEFCACRKQKIEQKVLTVAVTEKTKAAIETLADAFQRDNPDVDVVIKEYRSEEEKNYYLSHGAGDADLYTFDYALIANDYKDFLYALDRVGPANRYRVSIANQLRADDNKIYVLPADGYCYSSCYNVAKLAEHRLEVPETVADLTTLSVRLKKYEKGDIYAASATIGGTNSVLFALMSVAYPLYLNTVSGTAFLSGYLAGDFAMSDDEYRNEWIGIFEQLKLLYDNGFYSLADLEKTAEEGVNRFNAGNAFAMQSTSSIMKDDVFAKEEDVVLSPFVGNSARDACFGSMPMLYLAMAKETGTHSVKFAAAKRFLEYYSTEQGQALIRKGKNAEDTAYVSYLKNVSVDYSPMYVDLQSKINEGRLFITDRFHYIFSVCTSDIVSFLSAEKNVDALLTSLDETVEAYGSKNGGAMAEIGETLAFDRSETYEKATPLGDYFANAFLYSDYIDAAIYPSVYLKSPLFSGTLSESELETVFPQQTMVYVRLKASDYVAVYQAINEHCYPVTAKVAVEGENAYLAGGKQLSPDELLYALIPKEYAYAVKNGTFGREQTSTDLLVRYFTKRKWRSEDAR